MMLTRSMLLMAALLIACRPALGQTASNRQPQADQVSEQAWRIHTSGLLFDGHNDLPWRLRMAGDVTFTKIDIAQRLETGQTDIPRLRQGGVKAQFWSVYIPTDHANPARTVTEQIDLVHRMVEHYPDTFALALSADDVERIANAGKIASLIGIEGGVAIEDDLAQLRAFHRQGVRYMTLTHSKTLEWADSATDEPRNNGLSAFGERVVREMNRLGMLVDISHVSPATMADALHVSRAPIIASHSSAYAVCPSPRNVPDEILKGIAQNRGVVMVNFYSGFVLPEASRMVLQARSELRARYPEPAAFAKAFEAYLENHKIPRGTVADVVKHIDHIVKVAGIDHVGLGGDYDGVKGLPVGLEDVSGYPRITEELVHRGYSEADIHKILGRNVLRALREAGKVAEELRKATPPEVDQPSEEPHL